MIVLLYIICFLGAVIGLCVSVLFLVHLHAKRDRREMKKNRLRVRLRMSLAFLVGAGFVLANCGRAPTPPAPTTRPALPLVVTVGGLGDSRMAPVSALLDAMPEVESVDMGSPNAHFADVAGYCLANPHPIYILAGHSFGAHRVCLDAAKLANVKLLILLDPVCMTTGESDITVPTNVSRCVVYRCTIGTVGIVQATMHGSFSEVLINRSHNNIPGDPAILEMVRREILDAI